MQILNISSRNSFTTDVCRNKIFSFSFSTSCRKRRLLDNGHVVLCWSIDHCEGVIYAWDTVILKSEIGAIGGSRTDCLMPQRSKINNLHFLNFFRSKWFRRVLRNEGHHICMLLHYYSILEHYAW